MKHIPTLAFALSASLCLGSLAHAQTSGGRLSRPAPLTPAASGASNNGLAKYEPAGNKVFHGASLSGTWDDAGLRTQIKAYEKYSGKRLSLITWYAATYFNGRLTSWRNEYAMPLQRVKKAGAVSLIKFSVQDSNFLQTKSIASTRKIAQGVFDAYFEEAAQVCKEFGGPVFISINHEMNGTWYPFSQDYPNSGVTAEDYVASYRRIVDIFRRKGANNVAWVWSPNVPDVGSVPFAKYYPGDEYTDWIGVSLYSGNPMSNLSTIYRTYAAKKPIFITEWATGEDKSKYYEGYPGDAKWVESFFKALEQNYPRVKAISWFQWDKRNYGESDYTLQRVPAQSAVYQRDIQNPRYVEYNDGLAVVGVGDQAPIQVVPREVVLNESAPLTQAPVARPAVAAPPVEKVKTERPRLQIVPREKVAREAGR